jgi:transposase
MVRHCLTDEQWALISDLFPKRKKTGRPPVDRRKVVNGILWIMRTGAPWRDLPSEFGKWGTVWDLFDTWNSSGLLDEILSRLRATFADAGLIDGEVWHVDGSVIRAARCAGGGGKKGIYANPRTMPLAGPAADSPRKSTSPVTTQAIR